MNGRRSNRQKGMSMVELMIAMTLGLMLTIGIGSLFMQSRTSFNQDEQIATMQSNLRFGMEMLVRDITMTGYWGSVLDPVSIVVDDEYPPSITTDCGSGWAYDHQGMISGVNNATGGGANSAFGCIASGRFEDGTDVIAIKRATANLVADADLAADDNGTVFIREDGQDGVIFQYNGTDLPVDPNGANPVNRVYSPTLYYVRNYSIDTDDGIPTLCRKVLEFSTTASPTMETECLVEGIEHLHFEYGIDSNQTGVANRYVSAPTAAQFEQVTSVRIHVLARSLRPQQGYDNEKTYVIGDLTYTPDDSFYRRAATTTVVLRNPSNLRQLGF